jgi:hypothetical protein
MRRMSTALVALQAVGSLLGAQTVTPRPSSNGATANAPAASATVEGEMYLLKASGDVNQAAASTVRLLRVTDCCPW